MTREAVMEEIRKLPDDSFNELAQYVEFLKRKSNGGASVSSTSGRRRIGGLRGALIYMADDFDAPLDDFQEYM